MPAAPVQESHSKLRRFDQGMRDFFESGSCGPAHVVDVFNMTDALVEHEQLAAEAPSLTHDGATGLLCFCSLCAHACTELGQP